MAARPCLTCRRVWPIPWALGWGVAPLGRTRLPPRHSAFFAQPKKRVHTASLWTSPYVPRNAALALVMRVFVFGLSRPFPSPYLRLRISRPGRSGGCRLSVFRGASKARGGGIPSPPAPRGVAPGPQTRPQRPQGVFPASPRATPQRRGRDTPAPDIFSRQGLNPWSSDAFGPI